MEKIIIEKEKAGKRIDIFISEQKQISRETAKRWIEQENVTINNKKVKPSYKTQENDIINIEPEEIKDIELKAQNIPLEVLYQDNDILVVNKPKGMVVHPANGNPDGTLVNAVMALCKDTLSGIGGELRPGIVHRLDKDTSGAIIIAKNDKSHIQLSEMLKNHEIEKTYIALVRGIVKENEATINMPISRSQNDRKKRRKKCNNTHKSNRKILQPQCNTTRSKNRNRKNTPNKSTPIKNRIPNNRRRSILKR